jgi:translation initiation factor 1
MGKRRERIETGGGEALDSNPFASLELGGLKAGPSPVPAPPPEKPARSKVRGELNLRKLKSGRGGKTVTEVSGFPCGLPLKDLLKDLQRQLGVGGTVRGQAIELQGDVRPAVKALLEADGFRVKGAVSG